MRERGREREMACRAVAASSKVDAYRFRGEGRFTISGIRGSRYSTYPCFLLQRAPSSSRYIRLRKNNWPRSRRKVVTTPVFLFLPLLLLFFFFFPSNLVSNDETKRQEALLESVGGDQLSIRYRNGVSRLIKVRGRRRWFD